MAILKHKEIAEALRRRIESGELNDGDQLPTELELQERYGASRSTVRDAIKSLASQHLVVAQPGRGTFVRRIKPFKITLTRDPVTGLGGGEGEAYAREAKAQGRKPDASTPEIGIEIATGEIAEALNLAENARVVSRRQNLKIDGSTWIVQTSYYSRELVQSGATRLEEPEDIEEGAVRYLESLGVEQSGYRDRLRIRPSTPEEDIQFQLESGSGMAVLESRRIAYDRTEKPFRFTVSVFLADRVEIAIEEGTVPADAPAKAD
jgi:GntR family transcriptional regulator